MNFVWKLLFGMLFWELVDGCDDVPCDDDFQDLDFEELELFDGQD